MYGYGKTSAYHETEVLSSSPERLVPLLYEQLLVSLKRGALFIQKGDIEGKHESLGRAQDIVAELLSALDFEVGGDLARHLASLYGYWSKEIRWAGLRLDRRRLEKVAEMVSSLHESWDEAARLVESGAAVPSEPGVV